MVIVTSQKVTWYRKLENHTIISEFLTIKIGKMQIFVLLAQVDRQKSTIFNISPHTPKYGNRDVIETTRVLTFSHSHCNFRNQRPKNI